MKTVKSVIMCSLIALLTIAGGFSCGSDSSDDKEPGVSPFGPAVKLADYGYFPTVAGTEDTNVVVEMHEGYIGLTYVVGTVNIGNSSMNWATSQGVNWDGVTPSISISNNSFVAEAHSGIQQSHNGNADGSIWTVLGIADVAGSTINWGPAQEVESSGYYSPSIAVSRDGKTAVLVYQQGQKGPNLYYRVGTVDNVNRKINWGPSSAYDTGMNVSVSMNDNGNIVAVHNSWQENPGVWYKVGKLDAENLTVNWGPTVCFNSGWVPKVSVGKLGTTIPSVLVFVVFQSEASSNPWARTKLWVGVGELNGMSIDWQGFYEYQDGQYPAIAWVYYGNALEVHNGAVSSFDAWYMLTK